MKVAAKTMVVTTETEKIPSDLSRFDTPTKRDTDDTFFADDDVNGYDRAVSKKKCSGHDQVRVFVAGKWVRALDVGAGRFLLIEQTKVKGFKRADIVTAVPLDAGDHVAERVFMRVIRGGKYHDP